MPPKTDYLRIAVATSSGGIPDWSNCNKFDTHTQHLHNTFLSHCFRTLFLSSLYSQLTSLSRVRYASQSPALGSRSLAWRPNTKHCTAPPTLVHFLFFLSLLYLHIGEPSKLYSLASSFTSIHPTRYNHPIYCFIFISSLFLF